MNKNLMALLVGGLLTAQAGLAHAAENRVVSYLTMWTMWTSAPEMSEKLAASKTDTFLLSFGEWSADGTLNFSEDALTPLAWDAYYLPTPYVSWTTLKYDHPDKKMMVAFGGQNYQHIWSHLESPEQREKIAQSLASLLKKPFPVYKKNLALEEVVGECQKMSWESACNLNNYQYAGDVYLDGINFDFGKASRLTAEENQNLLALVSRLRELVGNKKLLSLTTSNVGADPENCGNPSVIEQCSYIEPNRSAHHGEVTDLLQQGKDLFDFFNVMTYDAGKDFRYKVALENYAKAIGDKSKVLMGTSINHQWAPEGQFIETQENNLERAAWQAKNGYGGIFVWALGQSTQNLTLTAQTEYVGRLADAAASALPDEAKPSDEADENQGEKITLSVPDMSKGPVLSWVDYQKGGEIRFYIKTKDMQDHYTIKLNGEYVYSVDAGTAYYSYRVDNGEGVNTIIHQLTPNEFNTGDLLTLHKEGHAEALQTITIGDSVRYHDDDAVIAVSASVNSSRVSVTLNKDLYNKPNRYMVLLNGNHLMQSFAGSAYYASVNQTAAGEIEISASEKIKAGDKIEVLRASGKPGVPGYSSSVLHTYYVPADN